MNRNGAITAPVFDIERFALHDGPGIRSTVFLRGCRLRCLWCQNPESMSLEPGLMFTEQKCVVCGECVEVCPNDGHSLAEGRHLLVREHCTVCGACAGACLSGALELIGRPLRVDEVLREVLLDLPFYRRSGGGLTISGGEPLLHPKFTRSLLEAAKNEGLHTALDTSGAGAWEELEALIPWLDLVLYDIKHTDSFRHSELTGAPNDQILSNLERLDQAGVAIWVRLPLVPGHNDGEANYHAIGCLLSGLRSVERVEILRYHRLAESKYRRLGYDFRLQELEPPASALAQARCQLLIDYGLKKVVWR